MRFESTKQALDLGEVSKWFLIIDGHFCEGGNLANCLGCDYGRYQSIVGIIIESKWDSEDAESRAREELEEEAVEEWRSQFDRHPDLFTRHDTPIVDGEEMPVFEIDSEEVEKRAMENFDHEVEFSWHEIEALVEDDPWSEEALSWIGLSFDDVQIDSFICRACGMKSDFDGRHCVQCTAPICENCFDNYCGCCGYDYSVEDKMEMEHGEARDQPTDSDDDGGAAARSR